MKSTYKTFFIGLGIGIFGLLSLLMVLVIESTIAAGIASAAVTVVGMGGVFFLMESLKGRRSRKAEADPEPEPEPEEPVE